MSENTPLITPKNKSVFDVMTSKTSFWIGFVAGIMAFCTVGFVLMVVASGGWKSLEANGLNAWKVKSTANANANSNSNSNSNTNAAPADAFDNLPPITKDDHIRGDLSKAKVVLVEYSDFECPFCKRFDPTMQQVVKDYGTDVAWVYRQYPLSFHENAQKEAEASECAAELGGNAAFWKFADAIYARTTSNGTGFALDKLGPLAKEIGLDQKKFQACLDSGKYATKVSNDEQGGQAAGVTGTPGTFALNRYGDHKFIEGAQDLATVKSDIDAILK